MTAINNNDYSAFELSATSLIALFAHKNSWYFDTGATNYLCNACNVFTNYIKFIIPQAIIDIGRSIISLGKDTVCLNVQLIDQSIMSINLHDVYYVPSLIANLVSGISLFRKGFYFHGSKCTFNHISDDQEVVYAPMVNRLFVLQVAYISLIALSSRDSAFTWHWQLGHVGFDSLKKALEKRSLDSKDIALIKLCKACAEAKQQRHLSYTTQQVPKNILDIIHTDVLRPITPTGFNGCQYYLVFINGYLRLWWAEPMKEKSKAFFWIKKFIIFIQNQIEK